MTKMLTTTIMGQRKTSVTVVGPFVSANGSVNSKYFWLNLTLGRMLEMHGVAV